MIANVVLFLTDIELTTKQNKLRNWLLADICAAWLTKLIM